MGIDVYDAEGQLQDLDWLRARYGEFIIQEAVPAAGEVGFKISALVEKRDVAARADDEVTAAPTVVVSVYDLHGDPMPDLRVAWYWPDADEDPGAGPKGGVPEQMRPGRAVSGPTNMNGDVGFGMGGGAYYWPDQGQIGPHATWIHGAETRSDLILGLGMRALTNHDHFDVVYEQVIFKDAPPPEECPVEEILDRVAQIENLCAEIWGLVGEG